MKKIIFIGMLFILSTSLKAQTYLQENFDTEIPATWTITDAGGATGDSWVSGQQGGANSLNGSNAAIVDSDANGAGAELIETLTSPAFDTTGATALFLDFDQFYQNIGADFAVVEVFDGTNWIEVLNQTATIGAFNDPDEQHIDITAYSNAAMQIRFTYNDGNVWAWYWLIDNVQVYNSTCNFPSGLNATNLTSTTADLSWIAGGTETAWEIINQVAGGPVPTDADSGIPVLTTPYTVTGLTEGTNYEFYIKADCGADGTSIWVGPFGYRIGGPGELCESAITVTTPLPYVTTDDTSNYGDDYSGTAGTDCGSGSGYLNGDDVVYAYSPTADTSIDIELSNLSANYAGAFIYTDCANIGIECETGAVNAFSTDDILIDNFSVTGGQTYYIVISTWAPPQSVAYTLTITENTCVDPEATYTVVSNCVVAPEFFIDVDVTDLGSAGSLTVSDDQASTPQTVSAAGILTFGPYANNTPVVISVTNDDDANCQLMSGTLTQELCLDTVVDCTAGPITESLCYGNNDSVTLTYTSSDGSPLNLTINTGEIEGAPYDFLLVTDGSGTPEGELYNGEGNDGDISGLTFQSPGDTITIQITSDGSVSCESGAFPDGIDFTVACATCVNPVASYSVVSNCAVGPEFFVDVDVTDLGSATSLTVSDNQGSTPQTTSAVGVLTFGPYANNTPVIITASNDDDVNCEVSSNALTQELCLDTVVDCASGPVAGFLCYGNNDSVTLTYTSSDGSPLNLTINSGEIEGDPFDFLLVTDGSGTPEGEIYNGEGNDGDISGLTFQSPGDTITIQITSDGSVSCESGAFPDGVDFTVACATCINPAATYQVIDDCDNGQQFLVDVNVSTLGDATSLTISNNIDTTTVDDVLTTGVYQVGPFPFGVDVIITLSNNQDVNCVINSSAIQLLACPPDNDNPCNATVAQVNADDSCALITSGTLLEATPSGVPNGSCTGDADDDVWFEFTALNDIQIISLLNIDSGGFFENIDHAVYEGTCNGPVELYCSDAEASVTPVLTIGNTYYVRVFSADNEPVDYTFDLCIRPGSGNVLVDQSTYTVTQLVEEVLINSPCAQISNITFSTGTDFGEDNGIGYFSNPDGGFPFEEGLLLTTGDASQAAGPNTNFVSSGSTAWPGDPFLEGLIGEDSNNATIVEFDFVPLNNELSFDFLMASEEYDMGTFECDFSDAFAFLLTDEAGVTTNLAVVPGTTDPILVTNIHPDNGSCPAINEQYFGEYIPDNLPPISFDGRTAVFTAFSPVNIGETYHIKLVIADARDSSWDSGVYLKAGSFDIGEVDLGGDITIAGGNAVCEDEPIILDTSAPNVNHVWYKDGFVIDGEIGSTLTVTEEGTYTVQIIFSPTCIIDDEVLIEFLPNPVIANTPDDLSECSTTNQAAFNLNDNDSVVLGTQNAADFTITYHESQTNADSGSNSLMSPYINTSNPQTIYVRIEDNSTGCFETTSFTLSISSPTHTANSVELIGCDNDDDGIASFDLFNHDTEVLNGQDASQFIVTYHTSQADADSATGALASPYDSSGATVFVRVETIINPDCYVTNSFDLVIGTEPETTFTDTIDYEVCPNATSPITITATPENYNESEVTINWYLDNGLIADENGLTLPVLEAGDYTIEVVFNDTGCSNEETITVIELENCVIPQGISPNGDMINDTFDLSSYGVTKLEIFNRNGTLVYSKKNYTNEWFGQTDDGDELPVGTYFYTMEYQNGKTRSAWIYIQREN
ncbi:choice-of-anchor L domain-containing protein [Psychroserpens mesophilus]|uniref:choice-of-anchor L domain-containing protein n=1 Tax=Psychroserpens mesophilus TaxID=325473 RepID=UPI003D651018